MACLFALVVVSPCVTCHAAGVSEARGALAAYREETRAAGTAQAANDPAGFAQHQAKAQEFLKQARQRFEAANAGASDDPEVLRDYADVLSRSGYTDLAADALHALVQRAPNDAAAWRDLGRALSACGPRKTADAIAALRRSLAIDAASPSAAIACTYLGSVYRKTGLDDLARECYTQALALDPSNTAAKLGMISQQIGDGQVREASDALDNALGALPFEYGAQLSSALAEGLRRFEQSRRWFPDTAENHMAYAKILFRAGRAAESLDAAERAAVLGPDAYTTWNFIGDLSRQLNNPGRAREAYQRSLALKPDQPRTQENLKSLDNTSTGEPFR